MIPTFRTDAEAIAYAEHHKPYETSLKTIGEGYERKWGSKLASIAEECRKAALSGDDRKLRFSSHALSLNLPPARPRAH